MPPSGASEARHTSSMYSSPRELPFLGLHFNQYHYLPECYMIKNNTDNCPTSRAQQGRWDCTKLSWKKKKKTKLVCKKGDIWGQTENLELRGPKSSPSFYYSGKQKKN